MFGLVMKTLAQDAVPSWWTLLPAGVKILIWIGLLLAMILGYDYGLRKLAHPKCPECGTRLTAREPEVRAEMFGGRAVVRSADFINYTCPKCGYRDQVVRGRQPGRRPPR